ncbi:MAG: hypothetical protein JRJ33_07690 [Deltaproteobacteria bacterium]|nr:hypothetical protein [Deltaproteobacteria bacterium]
MPVIAPDECTCMVVLGSDQAKSSEINYTVSIIMIRVTGHTQSGWLGFFSRWRKNTMARQGLNRCGCNRVHSAGFKNTQLGNFGISLKI